MAALVWHRDDCHVTHQLGMPLQDLTARARDSLVSFGERLSTRLFAALLNSQVC